MTTKKARKKRTAVTEAKVRKIREMAEKGMSNAQICRMVNLCSDSVRRVRRRLGIDSSNKIRKRLLREVVVPMLRRGDRIADISRRVGVSSCLVAEFRNEEGMAKMRRLDEETVRALVERVRDGQGLANVAREMGIKISTACRACRRNGVTPSDFTPPPEGRKRCGRERKFERVAELLSLGFSINYIMERLGVAYGTVYQVMSKSNISKLEREVAADRAIEMANGMADAEDNQ